MLRPGGRLAILEITQPRGALKPFFSLWFDRVVPLLGKVLPGGSAYTYLPASVKRFPSAEGLAALLRESGFGDVRFKLMAGTIVALHTGTARMSAARAGERDAGRGGVHGRGGGRARARGRRTARARAGGGGRGARRRRQAAAAAALLPHRAGRAVGRRRRAVEMVHMATLVHDDLVDGARLRRGLPAAWSVYGADAAKAAGDYLYACAFAVLAETGDGRAVATLADAALCLARGEAMQKLQTHDPATPVEAYLERCALKTGKLIEAACLLGSGGDAALGAYGLSLGIAFQIADDILDCAGETQQTGKIPGTDLREGTPTMPLLLAAARGRRRARGARRRAARRRARARRRDGRARALARGRARLRCAARVVPRRAAAPRGARSVDLRRRGPRGMTDLIKLGRIGYVNMAPVFFRLDAEVEEVVGVPDRAQPPARRGRARRRADLVDRVRAQRRHAAAAAAALRVERRRGRVDPADLEDAARADPHRRGDARVRDVGRADEGAVPRRGAGAARRGRRGEAADRRRRVEVRVRGPDAASRSRPPVARAHRPADGVRGLGGARAGASRAAGARGRARRVAARRARGARAARVRVGGALRLSGRLPRALLREAALSLRPARARGPLHVPRAGARRRRARRGARAALRQRGRAPSEHGATSDTDGEHDQPRDDVGERQRATSAMHAAPPTTFSQRGQRRCAASCVQADAFAIA